MTEISVETKAEFLYQVFQDWQDGEYRDEPINSVLANNDLAQSICLLFVLEMIDLDWNSDFAYHISQAYDTIYPLVQVRVSK